MKTWLFNPFQHLQTRTLTFWGILSLLIGSALGYLCKARFDGVVDVHFANQIHIYTPLLDNIINISILSLLLFAAGKIVNQKTRFIDVLNSVLISRIVFYILALFNITDDLRILSKNILESMDLSNPTVPNFASADIILLLIFSLAGLLMLVWNIIILYNGYQVASHAKSTRAIVLFIIALLLAEIFSKLLITSI